MATTASGRGMTMGVLMFLVEMLRALARKKIYT